MPSRRSFLLSSFKWTLGSFLLSTGFQPALARKTPRATVGLRGPHTLSRDQWPPAILPAHVGIADKGYLCFTDDFGQLAIIDMRKPVPGKAPYKIVASLGSLGNKVVDFAITQNAAYGLVYQEGENREPVAALVSVNLTPVDDPTKMSEITLSRYSDVTAICAGCDMICLSGTSTTGENLVSIYSAPNRRGQGKEPGYIASLSLNMPVKALDLSEKQLTILSTSPNQPKSEVHFVDLSNPSSPEVQKSLPIDGDFRVLTRFKDNVIIAGYKAGYAPGKGGAEAKNIVTGVNAHLVASITLDPLLSVESISAQKERILVVGRSRGARSVISLTTDREKSLRQEQVLAIAGGKQENGLPSQGNAAIVYREPCAYVASGWDGVQMLTRGHEGFSVSASYTIPRLAASGLAIWGDDVVLAGSKLQRYNIARPERPFLVSTTEPAQPLKTIIGAGSFVLCLSKDTLTLEKISSLGTVIAEAKVQATQLCFDRTNQRCYAIKCGEKSTRVNCFKVYSDRMDKEQAFEVPGAFTHCRAKDGTLLLTGLSDLVIVKPGDAGNFDILAQRHFDNLAVRDAMLVDDVVLLTAIDQNSKGFFLTLQASDKEAHTLGSIDLPHDGVALAADGTKAVAVGRSGDKDALSIIDFTKPQVPQMVSTIPAIEGVSSVSIRENLAILGGRGLEIVSLG